MCWAAFRSGVSEGSRLEEFELPCEYSDSLNEIFLQGYATVRFSGPDQCHKSWNTILRSLSVEAAGGETIWVISGFVKKFLRAVNTLKLIKGNDLLPKGTFSLLLQWIHFKKGLGLGLQERYQEVTEIVSRKCTRYVNSHKVQISKFYTWWLSWMRRPTGDQEVAGSTPAEVGNILSWRLIMKYFLRSFSPFRWFKKGSCQFLAKECAQYWLTA